MNFFSHRAKNTNERNVIPMFKVLSLSAISLGLLVCGQAHSTHHNTQHSTSHSTPKAEVDRASITSSSKSADSTSDSAANTSLINSVASNTPTNDLSKPMSQTHASFSQAPFLEALAQQIAAKAPEYSLGKISFTRVEQSPSSLGNAYYIGNDGDTSMLVKNERNKFSALLSYNGGSYQFNASSVKVLRDEFNKTKSHESDGHSAKTISANSKPAPSKNSGFGNSFWESYLMSNTRSTQSTQDKQSFYRNFATHAVKKVRVLVSENAIIEEYENNGELNFSSLYERIQTGIDLANLALVTSGVDALQIATNDIVIQRLPYDYIDDVVLDDRFKRVAFPTWGEEDATFQMTALALTQNQADIIYNLGARTHFQNNACGFANIGVNGTKNDPASYSTDHTYPVAINIKLGCETGRTPVHELGHTIGLNHERDNNGSQIISGSSESYAHNFGYTSLDAPAYSIMSYGLKCKEAQPSVSCARSNFFSSPKLTYRDITFGVPKTDPEAADAVRFLNDTWALRFSNHLYPINIEPLQSGGFTIRWDMANRDPQSQILVLSRSAHLRYNYVLDNHAVYNHEKVEIPLAPNQSSYTFDEQQIVNLGLSSTPFDTVSLFTGHVNEYDDIIPNLHAQLHAGKSLFTQVNGVQSTVILLEGDNVKAPVAGETVTFTFDASSIDNFNLNDLKIMTVLDAQYNAGFTTAVHKREHNPTNPMLDFVDYDLSLGAENKIELRLSLSADYMDYLGFLKNRESSNYKLPVVGFYFEYNSNQNGNRRQTISQEVAVDLRNALKVVPFIQAETLVKVIDNDRVSPLAILFSSTQEIAPSDVYASVLGASVHDIGDVVTTWQQLPNKDNKYQYSVTLENPQAIDDEGNSYASVSFGLSSLNLFSTSMVIASTRLMFEENNATSVKVSSQIAMPLSFSVTNLPQGNYEEEVSVSKAEASDDKVMVDGSLSRVNDKQGIVSFMFDPAMLEQPDRLRVNALMSEQGAYRHKAYHWIDLDYNSAPQIVVSKTTYMARPGETVTIPTPLVTDTDNHANELIYSWQKAADAPQFSPGQSSIQISIADNAKEYTRYEYTIEVSDGIDTANQTYSIDIEKAAVVVSGTHNTATNVAVQSSPQTTDTGGGSLGRITLGLLCFMVWYRRFNPSK
jgi:hypothetical protein